MAKRIRAKVKSSRLEARTRVIRGAVRLAFVAFCASVGFVVVATAFPQLRELEKMEAKLELAREREKDVEAELEYYQISHKALREDPSFLEIQARDRLDYYQEGERVLKFSREN